MKLLFALFVVLLTVDATTPRIRPLNPKIHQKFELFDLPFPANFSIWMLRDGNTTTSNASTRTPDEELCRFSTLNYDIFQVPCECAPKVASVLYRLVHLPDSKLLLEFRASTEGVNPSGFTLQYSPKVPTLFAGLGVELVESLAPDFCSSTSNERPIRRVELKYRPFEVLPTRRILSGTMRELDYDEEDGSVILSAKTFEKNDTLTVVKFGCENFVKEGFYAAQLIIINDNSSQVS